jgi:glucose-1-phosphate adenylyltransferase
MNPRPRPQPRPAQARRALVLAGGRGSRLKSLTDRRAKPAVYFGGKFRIVDFRAVQLPELGHPPHRRDHPVQEPQPAAPPAARLGLPASEMNEFVDLLPAQQRVDEESWYRGTADAVYQNQDILAAYRPSTSWCWPATTSTR